MHQKIIPFFVVYAVWTMLPACTIVEQSVRVTEYSRYLSTKSYLLGHFHMDPKINGDDKDYLWCVHTAIPYGKFVFKSMEGKDAFEDFDAEGYFFEEILPGRYRFVGLKYCLDMFSCHKRIPQVKEGEPPVNPELETFEIDVKPGEIVYLGHVRFVHTDGMPEGRYTIEIVDKADESIRWVRQMFPQFGFETKAVRVQLMKAGSDFPR